MLPARPEPTMRIGIDVRRLRGRNPTGLSQWLPAVLGELFGLRPQDEFVVFSTAFNRGRFEPAPANVSLRTIPSLDGTATIARLAAEIALDVLVRTPPGAEKIAFPAERQVVLVEDVRHLSSPETCSADQLRSLQRVTSQALASAVAVVTSSEAAGALRACPDLRGEVVWVPSPEQGALALSRACDLAATSSLREVYSPPLVSIVTPSLDQARFLGRTIDSVLAQTYPHLEYLVMDGGSADGSVDVLRSYGDRLTWASAPDRGQADAINRGFARSRGQIRAYLNSDDVLLPQAVESAVEHFRKAPDCDLVYGQAWTIDAADTVTGMYWTDDYTLDNLERHCCICQPAAFWTTRLAQRIGDFDLSLHYAMDLDYWLRIDRAGGRIEHVRQPWACTRLHPDTKTRSARRAVLDEVFATYRRHTGRVHRRWYSELWYHRCREASGWPRLIGWAPGVHRLLGLLHHAAHHSRQFSPRAALSRALRTLRRQVANAAWLGPVVGPLRRFHALAVKGRLASSVPPDNWLGPAWVVRAPDGARDEPCRLAGTPCADMRLTVRSGRRVVGVFDLQAGRYQRLELHVPPGAGRSLRLRFSDWRLERGRPVSFRVEDTNLVAEPATE